MEAPPFVIPTRISYFATSHMAMYEASLKSFTGVAHPPEMKRPGLKGGLVSGRDLSRATLAQKWCGL